MDQNAIRHLESFPEVTFQKGDILLQFRKGEPQYIYYLTEGTCIRKATTATGEEIFFEEYHPTTSVYALLGPYIKYAKMPLGNANEMVALSNVRAHRLTANEFDAFLDNYPAVMKELLQRLLNEYTMLMNNFIAKQKGQAAPRVASFILERAERVDGRLLFSRFCSVSDIARFLGMHRITANKIILALRSVGCITYTDNAIEILDPELLEEFASGMRKIDYKK